MNSRIREKTNGALNGLFVIPNSPTFRPLKGLVNATQPNWSGLVRCFKGTQDPLHSTLLAHFDPTYQDPWLVLTDLAPDCADIAWYGMRAWIEPALRTSIRAVGPGITPK